MVLEHQPQRDPPGGHVLGWDRRLCSLVCVRVFRRLRPLQAQPHHCWARSRLGISKDVPGLTLGASQTPRLLGCVPSSGSLWSLVPDPGGLAAVGPRQALLSTSLARVQVKWGRWVWGGPASLARCRGPGRWLLLVAETRFAWCVRLSVA